MRSASVFLFGLGLYSGTPALAQDTAVHVATYVDVAPQSAGAADAALKAEAAATSKDTGNREAQALREIGHGNRFAVIETWTDRASFEAHDASSHAAQGRDRLAAIELAPPDRRLLAAVGQEPQTPFATGANAVWVVTHVDVTPDYMDEASAMLAKLRQTSTGEAGNLRFLVTHQPDRPNHFTIIESWADRASFEAHQAADATKRFREKVNPMLGALYDQRIYRAVD
jgi:quinol monooxygenase YgiN